MKKNIALLVLCVIVMAACRKHLENGPGPAGAAEAGVSRDSLIAGINREIAMILEQVYKHDSAYAEVNAAIRCGFYADERVLLKDLLFPESSELYRTEAFGNLHSATGVFKREFEAAMTEGNYPLLAAALARESAAPVVPMTGTVSNNLLIADQRAQVLSGPTAAAIYFPYSTNFEGSTSSGLSATIVAADRDANTAPGREPYHCAEGAYGVCYKEVTVDDDYAEKRPTHIVENGARPRITGIADNPPATEKATRVYLGWARLTRQMDALISFTGNGGGSEIKVARLSGYLKKEDEQVTSFSGDVVTLDFSRGDIRRKTWKRIFSVWDPNWTKDDSQEVFAVYEDDTKGTKTFAGTLSTTVSTGGAPARNKAVGEISYKVQVMTQDDIITQRKYDRSSFFRDGMNNQGWGFIGDSNDFLPVNSDWPIFDGGTIWQYSMPWRMY